MAITDTLTVGVKSTSGVKFTGTSTEVGSSAVALDVDIPAASTNLLVAAAFTVANVQSCVILCTQDATLKTNSSGSPANTINLKAGIAYIWRKSAGYNSLLFTTDVTAWYLTSTPACNLQAEILVS